MCRYVYAASSRIRRLCIPPAGLTGIPSGTMGYLKNTTGSTAWADNTWGILTEEIGATKLEMALGAVTAMIFIY